MLIVTKEEAEALMRGSAACSLEAVMHRPLRVRVRGRAALVVDGTMIIGPGTVTPAGRADSEVPESDMARVHWQAPAKVASGCATRPRHVVGTALDSLQQAEEPDLT